MEWIALRIGLVLLQAAGPPRMGGATAMADAFQVTGEKDNTTDQKPPPDDGSDQRQL